MVINVIYLIILVTVIVAIFFIPIKIDLYIKAKGKNVYYDYNLEEESNNAVITIKILGVIPIFKYNYKKEKIKREYVSILDYISSVIKKNQQEGRVSISDITKKSLKFLRKIKFEKLILIGGFNTEDYVKNTYLNASINTIICMIINGNQKKFNLNNLYYQVSISNYDYYLTLNSIIKFYLVHNIDMVFSIFCFILKTKRTMKKEIRRVEKNGRTSNRKFNDDSNEFA